MKRMIACCIISAFAIVIHGQKVVSSGRTAGNPELNRLDQATIRCYYQFVQKDKAGQLQTDTMTLDVGSQISEYYDITKQNQDSLISKYLNKINPSTIRSISVLKEQDSFEQESAGGTTFSSGRAKESARLFKNRQTGEITIIDYLSSVPDKYKFTETIQPQAWQITSDTATILGYQCQKATATFRGRNYEAWFSPEIPVNDGPWKFFGLPGLILKVTDTGKIFSFVCVGMENLDPSRNIAMQKAKYINCSRDELAKIKKKQGGETRISINGGDIVMASMKAKDNYYPLEVE